MDPRRPLSILYGSETGTAESIAVRLYRESKRYHFDSRVFPMDAYPAAEIVQVYLEGCPNQPSSFRQGQEQDFPSAHPVQKLSLQLGTLAVICGSHAELAQPAVFSEFELCCVELHWSTQLEGNLMTLVIITIYFLTLQALISIHLCCCLSCRRRSSCSSAPRPGRATSRRTCGASGSCS